MTTTTTPAERHRRVAATFSYQVDHAEDWGAPTPVPAWRARDVVGHLTGWFPGFLAAGAGVGLAPGPAVAEDPVGAWRHHVDAVQALLDDPDTAGMTFELTPHIPATPLPEAIDRFYTTDVLMHTWDLARANGRPDGLDPAECAEILAGMEPLDDLLRRSGQYGPRQPVSDDADGTVRLMAFVGRDPAWPHR